MEDNSMLLNIVSFILGIIYLLGTFIIYYNSFVWFHKRILRKQIKAQLSIPYFLAWVFALVSLIVFWMPLRIIDSNFDISKFKPIFGLGMLVGAVVYKQWKLRASGVHA